MSGSFIHPSVLLVFTSGVAESRSLVLKPSNLELTSSERLGSPSDREENWTWSTFLLRPSFIFLFFFHFLPSYTLRHASSSCSLTYLPSSSALHFLQTCLWWELIQVVTLCCSLVTHSSCSFVFDLRNEIFSLGLYRLQMLHFSVLCKLFRNYVLKWASSKRIQPVRYSAYKVQRATEIFIYKTA